MQMVLKTTTTPADGEATTTTETLNFSYDASGVPLALDYNGTDYYYVTNIQGDIMAILNTSGEPVVQYNYDAWGKLHSFFGSMEDTLGEANPLTYRGYVYDQEIGYFYLQSRYYDPEVGRFLNADGLVATGQGLLGNNMFAYCNNNAVFCSDPTGYAAGGRIYTNVSPDYTMSGPVKYSTKNAAALAFANEYDYLIKPTGNEYGAIIYSMEIYGSMWYCYGALQTGGTTTIDPNHSFDPELLDHGWTVSGFVHTHPNTSDFSGKDMVAHIAYLKRVDDLMYDYTSYLVYKIGSYTNVLGMKVFEDMRLDDYLVYSPFSEIFGTFHGRQWGPEVTSNQLN